MRHYCNRQNPERKKTEINDEKPYIQAQIPVNNPFVIKREEQINEEEESEPIFPPSTFPAEDINLEEKYDSQIDMPRYPVYDAQGGSVSQRGGFVKQLTNDAERGVLQGERYDCETCKELCRVPEGDTRFNDMSGSIGFISLPTRESGGASSMSAYLSGYKGKYVCIDLWSSDGRRIEKCGMLLEIGDDFLVVRKGCTGEVTIIDLKTIRYISIYCR